VDVLATDLGGFVHQPRLYPQESPRVKIYADRQAKPV